MKTTFWTVGLVVLGCILSVANSQYGQSYNSNDNDDVGYSIQVQSSPLNIAVPTFTIQTSNKENEESELLDESNDEPPVEINTAGENEPSSAILLQDADLSGNAGILVIQNNDQDTSPILYELRPVASDTDTFYYGNDEMYPDAEVVQNSEYESVEEDSNENRIKPNDDLDDDSNEDYTPQRVRSKKNKQRQTNRNTNLRPKTKKSKRRRRPSNGSVNSGKLRPKRKRRPSRPLKSQRKPIRRRKTKNKNRKGNRKRNKTKSRRPANISESSHQNNVNTMKDKKKKVAAENSLTKTLTTSHTGTADTRGGVVNHIVINKEPAPTTRKPFWRILGRSAINTEDKSFKLRKRYSL